MKVSIITVCFNSAATIRETIESVLAQTHNEIEYIIVDGASIDDTLPIISEYSSMIAHLISEPDSGLYDAMNKGIEISSGDVVGILNSDDIYQSNTIISQVVAYFGESPSADMVFGDVVFVGVDEPKSIVRHYNSKSFRPWKLRFGWMPPHPATFIKKSAYDKVGLYSLKYKISSDYEMFVRMLLVNRLSATRMNEVLVRMKIGGISTSGIKGNILLNLEIVKACRANGVYTNLLMICLKIPFKIFEFTRKTNI